MKEQCFCICVEVELCFPCNKNSSETFQDQSHAYLTLQLINDPPWKEAKRQATFLAPPSEQVKGDIVDLKFSQTSFLYK